MIRPRGAGFCYNDIEFEVMKEDARCMLENKADGIAFGCLNQDGSINEKQTKEMIDIIKEYQGEVVFHRAFDCVADPYASIELLIHLGVDSIKYIVHVKIGSMTQQLKRMKFHMPMHLRLMKMIMMLFQKNLLKKL